MMRKAICTMTVFLCLVLAIAGQEREVKNPDAIAPQVETYHNLDGTITTARPLPDGRLEVNGKVLTREEFEKQRSARFGDDDPTRPRPSLGRTSDEAADQGSTDQPELAAPWDLLVGLALGGPYFSP